MRIHATAFLCTLLIACGGTPNPSTSSMVYPDGIDRISVNVDMSNLPAYLHESAEAVGRGTFATTDEYCTVTHIGQNIILTAGHCVIPNQSPRVIVKNRTTDCTIQWGYRGSSTNPQWTGESTCHKIIRAEYSNQRDFALIEVSAAPTHAIPFLWDRPVHHGDSITLLSHNEGHPLQWTQTCQIADIANVRSAIESVRARPGRVFRNFKFTAYDSQLFHRCDALAGSSGSAMLALERNEGDAGWRVAGIVGVHDFEVASISYNGGTRVSSFK